MYVIGFFFLEVDWVKDGEKIEDGGCFFLFDGEDDGYFLLIIEIVILEDVGKYECIVFNEVGEVLC